MYKILIKLLKEVEEELSNYKLYAWIKNHCINFKRRYPVTLKIVFILIGLFYTILVTLYIFFALELNVGLPKGYDSLGHMVQIEFVEKSFPYIFWNPFWHNGIVSFPSSYPLYHEILGIIVKLTDFSSGNLINYGTILSLIVTVASVFGITYLVSRRMIFALSTPFLIISASAYWSFIIQAGLHLRIVGFAFYLLNIFLLLLFLFIKNGKIKKIVYPFVVLTFVIAILSHLYTTLFAFITLSFFIFIFAEKGKKVSLWIKTMIISAGLTSFYYLPYMILKPVKLSMFGKFKDAEYLPITLDMLLKQQYPGMSALILPLVLILIFLIMFVRSENNGKEKNLEAYKLAFFFFNFLGMAFVVYSLKFFDFSISSLYPSNCLFFASIFFTLSIIFGIAYLGKETISTRIIVILFFVLSALSINSVEVLSTHRVENSLSKSAGEIFSNIDETKNYRFTNYDQKAAAFFNLAYDALQTRGYATQSVLSPAFNYWFEQVLFVKENNMPEVKFVLDWYGINNVYISPDSKSSITRGFETKFDNEKDFVKNGKSFLYLKNTPMFFATNSKPVFIKGNQDKYEKTVMKIAERGWSINKIIPLRLSSWDKKNIPVVASLTEIESDPGFRYLSQDCVWISSGETGDESEDNEGCEDSDYMKHSEDKLKVDFKNNQRWEVELNESYKGLIFKQSYFRNWKAFLMEQRTENKVLRTNLPVYQAGPGMMYVFLPEFKTPSRVVFEYKLSWVEYAGFSITILTIIVLIALKFIPTRLKTDLLRLITDLR